MSSGIERGMLFVVLLCHFLGSNEVHRSEHLLTQQTAADWTHACR